MEDGIPHWILPEINICQSTEPWIWISFPKFGDCSTVCDYWGCIKGYPVYYYSVLVLGHWQDDKWQVGPRRISIWLEGHEMQIHHDAPITVSGMGHCTVRAEKWLGLAHGDWPLGRPNPGQVKIPLRPSITRPRSNLLVWFMNRQDTEEYAVCMEYEYSLGQYVVGSSGTLYGVCTFLGRRWSVLCWADGVKVSCRLLRLLTTRQITSRLSNRIFNCHFRHFENPSNPDLVEIWLNVRGYLSKRSWPSCSTR